MACQTEQSWSVTIVAIDVMNRLLTDRDPTASKAKYFNQSLMSIVFRSSAYLVNLSTKSFVAPSI